ncbi:MAG: zinc-dependent metalloprotease [Catalinimonas sp.]
MLLSLRLLILLLLISTGSVWAQDKDDDKPEDDQKGYADLITAEAKTDSGLFQVHLIGEKVYYEIPKAQLGRDFLLVSRIRGCPPKLSPYLNAGSKVNEQVVRWELTRGRVLLRVVSFNSVADDSLPIARSVRYNNYEPILQNFKVATYNEDSSAVVVDVTPLFTQDVAAIGGLSSGLRKEYEVGGLDAGRSFVDTVRSYPENIEVLHTQTFKAAKPPAGSRANTITMLMNQSMIALPDDPMTPRLHDPRVGWFTVRQVDYSSQALKADEKSYVRRWRLVPKDTAAYLRGELVEPIEPIVYYLDPATPAQWRPYFKRGIEDWQVAFERAGFKRAIIAKDPPTAEEDPDFSPEDARYSVVRYVASTTRNAVGPSVSDPRTGEILESDIIWYHNHLRSYRNRHLLETGAANPRARTLDTPEEEMGEMMRRVISHEVGHAIGLPHNMKASAAYPVDSLRSGTFTQQYGIATTIMDYARYNYVAQPGDEGIRFIRQLGPYDLYAVEWGYRWYPNVRHAEDELPRLRAFVNARADDPRYQFGSGYGYDPDAQTENVGDDPVAASTYGLQNLKRVAPELVNWTTTEGEGYDDLAELYGELVSVWSRYVGHVVANVGGVRETLKTTDQAGVVYAPVDAATQRASVRWLLDNAFATPEWLLETEIARRIEPAGAVERVRRLQTSHLNRLLDAGRMQRLTEAEALADAPAYPLTTFLADLRRGIWAEAYAKRDADVYRRNLQRAYLEQMGELLHAEEVVQDQRGMRVDVGQSDIKPAVRAELEALAKDLKRVQSPRLAPMGRYHLRDSRARIAAMLEPGA